MFSQTMQTFWGLRLPAYAGFLFASIPWERKTTLPSLAPELLVLQVSFLLTQATPAVEVPSRMCWCHLTSFVLIHKTQRPEGVRTEPFPQGGPKCLGKGALAACPFPSTAQGLPLHPKPSHTLTWPSQAEPTQGLLNRKPTDPCTCWNLHERNWDFTARSQEVTVSPKRLISSCSEEGFFLGSSCSCFHL